METEQYSCTACKKCGEIQFSGDQEHFASVKCKVCGKYHKTDSDTFVAVSGNITRGFEGGLVGNNIKNDIVTQVSIFCVGECFKKVCLPAINNTIKYPPPLGPATDDLGYTIPKSGGVILDDEEDY